MSTTEAIEFTPAIIIPADMASRADAVHDELRKITPALDTIIERALQLRAEYGGIRDLLPAELTNAPEVDEALGRVTGWNDLWEALVGVGDRLGSDVGLQYLPGKVTD